MVITASGLKMRAVVAHGPGSIDKLRIEEVDRPVVPKDGVLVRVHASSVNPVDLYTLTPVAHLQRSLKPAVMGTDISGTVETVGAAVTRFKAGDEVFGGARGAFAEFAGARDRNLAHKPAGVSFENAGTLAVAGCTALQAVRDHGRVSAGQRVLINGASGGVGTFLVQIAKAFGAEVTAVCSARNVELARSLGADRIVDYSQADFTDGGERYDVMLDVAGNRSWSDCMRILERGAICVAVGAAGLQHGKGGTWRALGHLLGVRVASMRSGVRATVFIARLNSNDLTVLGNLVESGRVAPVIDRRYDLSQAADAMAYLNEGHSRGKIAIEIGASRPGS